MSTQELNAALLKAQMEANSFNEAVVTRLIWRHENNPRKGRTGIFKTPVFGFYNSLVFGLSDCWYWRGSLTDLGYGVYGRSKTAHRLSWEIHNGKIPDGLHVLHRCDVRSCVNPRHLFLGTHQDNMKDMVAKGRTHKGHTTSGEKSYASKLTQKDADLIREKYIYRKITLSKLGEMFGVSAGTIHGIVKNKRYL